jgi:hypothetical protein
MGWRRIAAGAAGGIAVLVAGFAWGESAWLWPLGTTPVLTSSFGEPRGTHPHAGIDLGTGGRTGVECYAVGDGWVARLRMSPFGYGKALYIQLDSGPLVVYAHLSRFGEPMAGRAWEEQVSRCRYTFDINLEPGAIRVRRGQVVAWSGDTGIGSPHLHFEVRDGDVARNPQTAGFAVRDVRPPVIREVEILPLDARTEVEGRCEPEVLRIGEAPLPRVRAAGRVGFAVRAIDRASPGSSEQSPYRYEVRVDGRPLYRAVHERFDYAVAHHIVLDYDQERLADSGADDFLLYKRSGNRLGSREPAAGDGGLQAGGAPGGTAISVGPGQHEVEIEVADVAGQSRRVHFPLVVSRAPRIDSLRASPRGDSLVIECTASDADSDSLGLGIAVSRDGGVTWESVRSRRNAGRWSAEVRWSGKRLAVRARVQDGSRLAGVRTLVAPPPDSTAGQFRIGLSRRSSYGRLALVVEPEVLLAEMPRVTLQSAGGERRVAGLRQTGERKYEWVAAVGDLEDTDAIRIEATAFDGRRAILQEPMRLRVVHAGAARVVDDLDPRVRFEFDADTLFEDVALELRRVDPRRLSLVPELRSAGLCFNVEPRSAALDGRVRVAVTPEEAQAAGDASDPPDLDSTGVGLFELDSDGEWSFLSARRGRNGVLVGETRNLGIIALLRDTTPPRVAGFRAVPAVGGVQLGCSVRDDGSGLADDAIAAEIDGVVAIPEWDPESGRVRILPTAAPGPGSHKLTVRAQDRVGNRASQTWEFVGP